MFIEGEKDMWDDLRRIIIETRKKKDMSQSDLAMMIGKEQSYIYCVESGQIKISEDIVCEIASALNIDLRTELYLRYSEEFEKKVCENKYYNNGPKDKKIDKKIDSNDTVKTSEKKTKPTPMWIRPSTKLALVEYARKNNTSANDVLENLAETYIMANKNQETLCEYAGITFNPVLNACMKRGEKKSKRQQLLLKESTKNGIKEIAEEKGTSLSDIIHRLADSFLKEWYK